MPWKRRGSAPLLHHRSDAVGLRAQDNVKRAGTGTISSKSTVLNAVLNGQARTERSALVVRLFRDINPPSGSAGRIRTYDQPINSRLLYH